MKKVTKLFLIILGILYFIYFILANTGIFRMYKNPTTANEPNINLGSRMFVSNLKTPKIKGFICFNTEDDYYGKYQSVFRLCAIENDTIEIKNGIVYLNNKNLDSIIDLMHMYKIDKQTYLRLKKLKIIENQEFPNIYLSDSTNITLSDNKAKKLNLTRVLSKNDNYLDNFITQKWTKDNFGPLIIPQNKLFVLGDNRDNALDSRFIGLIDKEDVIGVVIKIFN